MNDMIEAMVHEGAGPTARSLLMLRRGWCLAISAALVRFARDPAALDDPLGNGVFGVIEIPPALAPRWQPGEGYVQGSGGGAVLLHGGTTVLVKPHAIELYASAPDALHARDCRGRIEFGRD